MQNDAPLHPPGELLAAFALGKLLPEEASGVESHLEGSTACVLAVQNTPADGFVVLVRSAAALGTSKDTSSVSTAATMPLPPSAAPVQLHPEPATGGATAAAGPVEEPPGLAYTSRPPSW
jgi:hypothetical protein